MSAFFSAFRSSKMAFGIAALGALALVAVGMLWSSEEPPRGAARATSAPAPAADSTQPDKSHLKAWYPMEETGSSAPRNDVHSTVNYSRVVTATQGAAEGLIGNAVALGEGDLRTTDATPSFPLDVTQDFTVVTWIRTPRGATGAPYLWRTGGGNANVRIQARPESEDYVAIVDDESGTEFIEAPGLAFGTWQMVTLRHEAATNSVRLSVDLQAAVADTLAAPLAGPSASEVRIDGRGAMVRLDEQSVWQANLSDAQLAWLHDGGTGRAYSDLGEAPSADLPPMASSTMDDLLAWYPMEESGAARPRSDAHAALDFALAGDSPVAGSAPGVQGQAVNLGAGGQLRARPTGGSNATPPLDFARDFTIVSWVYVPESAEESGVVWAAGDRAYPRLKTVPWKERYTFILPVEGREELARLRIDGLTPGAWQMVAVRYDAEAVTVRLRVGSGAETEAALSGPIAARASLAENGVWWSAGGGGLHLDEQSVWQTYLSDERLDWLYNGGAGRTYDDL